MPIIDVIEYHQHPEKIHQLNKSLPLSDNVNAYLNFLTIDDIIYRCIWNSGLRDITPVDYNTRYKEAFGRKAFGGKTVIVRAGIDVPIDSRGRIAGTERLQRAIPTLDELSGYGARIVVIGHQGRAGKYNFIELDGHARLIRKLINRPWQPQKAVKYLGNLTEKKVITNKIRALKDGEILILNNIRFLVDEVFIMDKPGLRPHEINQGSRFVSILEPLCDFYVNDAFNTSHRKHASMIGFTNLLNLVGRQTEIEMMENKQVIHIIEYPFVPIFGGLKVGDYMGLIKNSVLSEKVAFVLLAGVPGIIALLSRERKGAERFNFGKATDEFLEKHANKGVMKFFRNLYSSPLGQKKLIAPLDFLVKCDSSIVNLTPEEIHHHPKKDRFHLWSIGTKTARHFVSLLLKAKTIYKKGPVGKCEEPGFEEPERCILEAIMKAQRNGAYTISSGGDSIEIAKKLGFDEDNLFSRLSDAGGAFVHVLEGNRIAWPMLQLNTHWNLFYGQNLRFGLPPHYQLKPRYRLELTIPQKGLPEALRYDRQQQARHRPDK
ncbi:MAG: phosphoglycerate kinase [Deltaproteobacteria bacterium]|nr:phosphoglycerate kinase [Deltaproteobacteria bacterium]